MTSSKELQAEIREVRHGGYVNGAIMWMVLGALFGIFFWESAQLFAYGFLLLGYLGAVTNLAKVGIMNGDISGRKFEKIPFWNSPPKRMQETMDGVKE